MTNSMILSCIKTEKVFLWFLFVSDSIIRKINIVFGKNLCYFSQANVPLVKLLIEKGSKVSMQSNKDKQNILHIMADQCVTNRLADMIKLFQVWLPCISWK